MRSVVIYTAIGGVAFFAGLYTRPTRHPDSIRPVSVAAAGDRDDAQSGRSSAARSRTRNERVLAMPGVRERSSEPTTTVDDPITLSDLGVPSWEIFEQQERDPAWAPGAERFLTERLAEYVAAMMPYATEPSIECRMSACRVAFHAPANKLDEGLSLIQSFPLGNVRLAPNLDRDEGTVSLIILYRPEVRPVEDMPRHYAEQEAKFFPGGYAQARAWIDEHGAVGDKQPERAP